MGMSSAQHTPEWRAKISAANKGRKRTPQQIAKSSSAHLGSKRSAEARAKMSAAASKRGSRGPLSQATKDKISAAHKGQTRRRPLPLVLAEAATSTTPFKNPRCNGATVRWSMAVRERDHHACVKCGTTVGLLDAHHIKPWKDHPELRFDLDNGQTVCRRCHRKQEPKTHCKRGHEFTPENTYFIRRHWRSCRACNAERVRLFKRAKAALNRRHELAI